MAKFFNAVTRSSRLIADEGLKTYLGRVFAKASTVLIPQSPAGQMLVDLGDAAELDWTLPAPQLQDPIIVEDGPVNIAWIMSPPGRESGGHQNLFRFIDFAEKAGHTCTVYLYTTSDFGPNLRDTKSMLNDSDAYPNVKADIRIYDRKVGVASDTQALFATGWETAYPAYLDKTHARRFYFVQDFEPSFYELGSQAILAENTYRFGFHGITAGGWLSHKLSTEYNMSCDSFDFAVNKDNYSLVNTERRNEVFFYARPVTARRAFELGIMALADFHRDNPDVTINLAGWDVSNWDIPFPHRNLSSLKLSELNTVYNRCAAGLVLSLTNMSLLPLELISAGVVPVVNDGPNNRMVSDNPYIDYCEPVPGALARHLGEAVRRENAPEHAIAMSKSVAAVNWENSGVQFNEALQKAMRG